MRDMQSLFFEIMEADDLLAQRLAGIWADYMVLDYLSPMGWDHHFTAVLDIRALMTSREEFPSWLVNAKAAAFGTAAWGGYSGT